MPKITFEKKEAIPEGLAETATEVDGKWVIDVVPKAKLDEFRDNNVTLAKERDELKTILDGVKSVAGDDLSGLSTELAELREISQKVKDGTLKGSTAVTAEVEARLKAAREKYEDQLREAGVKQQQIAGERDEYKTKFERSIIDRGIMQAVVAEDSPVNPAALPDIMERAYKLYTVTPDGKLVAKDGDTVVYGADGATPMQPKEWLGKVIESAPYLARPSAGSGAPGGDKGKMPGGMSSEAFEKLPPSERIKLARKQA